MMALRTLTFDEVRTGLADDTITVVDVRESHEFALGHIPGSVSLPLSRFDPAEVPIAPGREIVFSCAAGVRSLQALEIARLSGLPVSAHYGGGFKGWVMSGGDVARD
jgi:rhodanese-related sulfurtransferase